VALATGWTAEEVAEILQVDANAVRNHFKCYRVDGLAGLNRVGDGVGGSPCLLTEEQLIALDIHLQANLYLSAKAIAHWVEETFGVSYTESGMTAVLHRLGYVYKKPRLIKRGEEQEIPTNTGRRRVNINGAIDLERLEPVGRFDDTINAECPLLPFQSGSGVLGNLAYQACFSSPVCTKPESH